MSQHLERYRQETAGLSTAQLIPWAFRTFGTGLSFASSLGAEDQVLLALLDESLGTLGLPSYALEVFTLDTGRLHQETLDLLAENRKRFRVPIRVYFPDTAGVESLVATQGVNGFYDSLENRKSCCQVRKILPLKRALAGRTGWMTGQRRDQSVTRGKLEVVEWDEGNRLYKLNPLADWSNDQVWEFIRSRNLPYNALHDQGFPSIGCAPCTRAVKPGEDLRAGRWWWEQPEHKECGLHIPGSAQVKKVSFLPLGPS